MEIPVEMEIPVVMEVSEQCTHRKSDSDLPYCNTITCRNYIARTDMWKYLNGWRYVGKVIDE